MSTTNLQDAALVATAAAAILASTQGVRMTPGTAAQVLGAAVVAAGPLVSPNVNLAIGLATAALTAVQIATDRKTGITHDELVALFAADDAAKAADAAAQRGVLFPQP